MQFYSCWYKTIHIWYKSPSCTFGFVLLFLSVFSFLYWAIFQVLFHQTIKYFCKFLVKKRFPNWNFRDLQQSGLEMLMDSAGHQVIVSTSIECSLNVHWTFHFHRNFVHKSLTSDCFRKIYLAENSWEFENSYILGNTELLI